MISTTEAHEFVEPPSYSSIQALCWIEGCRQPREAPIHRASTPAEPTTCLHGVEAGELCEECWRDSAATDRMVMESIDAELAEEPSDTLADPHPGYDCGGTCAVHRFAPPVHTPSEASSKGKAPPERKPTAAEVLGLLTVHLLQEHWDEAREIANEIRIDFLTDPARPIAIDFVSTHDAELGKLREDIKRAITVLDLSSPYDSVEDACRQRMQAYITTADNLIQVESEVEKLRGALRGVSIRTIEGWGACWCEKNWGSANICDHTPACAAARSVLQSAEGEE